MVDTPQGPGGRRGAQRIAAAAVLLLLGAVVLVVGLRGSNPAPPQAPDAGSAVTAAEPPPTAGADPAPPHPDAADFGVFLPGSEPTSLSIPAIGVRANEIVALGLASDGSIQVPEDPATPGWFTPGPSPGQLGPAIIAGHVDSNTGPAVFYRLGELRPGDRVTVDRKDGSVATFEIHRVESFEKDRFPTRKVYGATHRAELRLITCSGEYDQNTGYLGNTVAFAHLLDGG